MTDEFSNQSGRIQKRQGTTVEDLLRRQHPKTIQGSQQQLLLDQKATKQQSLIQTGMYYVNIQTNNIYVKYTIQFVFIHSLQHF